MGHSRNSLPFIPADEIWWEQHIQSLSPEERKHLTQLLNTPVKTYIVQQTLENSRLSGLSKSAQLAIEYNPKSQ